MIAKLLDSVDFEAAAEATLEDILCDCREGSLSALEFAHYHGIDDPDDYDPRSVGGLDPEFILFARSKARERVAEEMDRIAAECEMHGGSIVLWRELVVDGDWLDGAYLERPIGVCWSWERAFAEAHHGEGLGEPGRVKALVKGLVDPSDVDWSLTVILNASHPYTTGDEKEIRLLPGRMIEIESIWTQAGKIPEAIPAREVQWPGRLLTREAEPHSAPPGP